MFISNLPLIVQPGKELCRIPVGIWCFPLSIRPNHFWFVCIHQLMEFRNRLTLHTQREYGMYSQLCIACRRSWRLIRSLLFRTIVICIKAYTKPRRCTSLPNSLVCGSDSRWWRVSLKYLERRNHRYKHSVSLPSVICYQHCVYLCVPDVAQYFWTRVTPVQPENRFVWCFMLGKSASSPERNVGLTICRVYPSDIEDYTTHTTSDKAQTWDWFYFWLH